VIPLKDVLLFPVVPLAPATNIFSILEDKKLTNLYIMKFNFSLILINVRNSLFAIDDATKKTIIFIL
jgi:hypothetical protein